MFTLTIQTGSQQISVPAQDGVLLSDLLARHIPTFAMPCGGNHTCGKCRVYAEGALSPPDAEEQRLLGEACTQGMRLACSCRVLGTARVVLPQAQTGKILSWYRLPTFPRTETGYGFAVDIGTTTVVVQLIDRSSGTILAEQMAENAQRSFGADVISRIEACKTVGVETLSQRIALQLEDMAAACLAQSGIPQVCESVVTGNPTMLHLYEGLDPSSLAVAPFHVASYFGGLSRRTLAGKPVYLPRCVGSYVGADILCAALAANPPSGQTWILADIGTNGEILLSHNGSLLCCSTAAGPAFEGAGLHCGMPAQPGAIRLVRQESGQIVYQTVADAPARGICGSGILDALAVMLETDSLAVSGFLSAPWQIGQSAVTITQKDIRQIQLAKASVCAGIQTLLEHAHLQTRDVDRFIIAGGFGNSINPASAAAIGLFPAPLQDRLHFIGNGALAGASMLLSNPSLRNNMELTAQQATELSLSASPEFMDHYIECMSLEPVE